MLSSSGLMTWVMDEVNSFAMIIFEFSRPFALWCCFFQGKKLKIIVGMVYSVCPLIFRKRDRLLDKEHTVVIHHYLMSDLRPFLLPSAVEKTEE